MALVSFSAPLTYMKTLLASPDKVMWFLVKGTFGVLCVISPS